MVSAYDVRPAVKEQVQSLGARFVELAIEAKDAQDARGYATAFFGKWHLGRRDPAAPLVGDAHAKIIVPPAARGGFEFWEGFESGFLLNDPWLHGTKLPLRTWLTGLCFYIPSPALAALAVGLGAVAAFRAHRADRTGRRAGLRSQRCAGRRVRADRRWVEGRDPR